MLSTNSALTIEALLKNLKQSLIPNRSKSLSTFHPLFFQMSAGYFFIYLSLDLPCIETNPDILERILTEILNNALKDTVQNKIHLKIKEILP